MMNYMLNDIIIEIKKTLEYLTEDEEKSIIWYYEKISKRKTEIIKK